MKIIVGIDGGPQQSAALALAARLADGGHLTVATVFPWSNWSLRLGPAHAGAVEGAAADVLRTAEDQLARLRPGLQVETRALADLSAPRALHRLAADAGADLLAIGACHRGPVGRAILGGTGDRLVHGAPCPVAVAPHDFAPTERAERMIGVAYDGGPESEAALAWADRLAEDWGASLELLSAVAFVPVPVYPGIAMAPNVELEDAMRVEAQGRLDAALDRLPASRRATGRVLDGPVVPRLAEAASDLDILVAGSRDYGPVGTVLFGSVSRGLMHKAPCPVIVVPRTAVDGEQPADPAAGVTSSQ